MLKTLITPGWQSDNVDTRLKSIQKMKDDDSASQSVLLKLANGDVDQGVRRAALFKMSDPARILEVSNTHADEETRTSAEAALWKALGAETRFDLAQSKALLKASPELLPSLIKHSSHVELRHELLDELDLAEQIELLGDIHYTNTRQLIAEKIDSADLLEKARHTLRGKDKSAEKIVRLKLDEIHEQQRIAQAQYAEAEFIVQKLELVAKQEWLNDSKAKLAVWQQRWQALEFTINADLKQRFELANSAAEALADQESQVASVKEQQSAMAKELTGYCRSLSDLSLATLSGKKHELIEKHNEAVEKWAALLKITPAETKVGEPVLLAKGAISSAAKFCAHEFSGEENNEQSLAKLFRTSLAELEWPSSYPALSAASEVQQRLDSLKAALKDDKQTAENKLDKLHKRVNRLLGTSKRGDISRAKGELAAITKAASNYKGKDKDALDERLEKASELVTQMSDWKAFATEPKFIELCESMEKLVGSNKHPDKLAPAISKLQDAWKALGHSDSSNQHWDRFKSTADAAYKPCAEFFAKRQLTRQKNLELREPLVTRMRDLLENTDWSDTPDYKKIENELQSIHNGWQKIKDVERKAGQKQWNRISKLRASVYEKLDIVYDANIALKKQIIGQAGALIELDVKHDTIDKLKFIQSKWKQIGVTRRKDDQAAWREFKKTTDAVFEKIQGQRKANRAAEDEKVAEYRSLIDQIYTLSKSAKNLAEADHEYERLVNEYQSLPPFPKGLPEQLTEKITSDYDRAESFFSKSRDKLLKQQKQGSIDVLLKKAALVAELESAFENAQGEKIQQLQAQIDAIQILNNEHNKRMQARITAAENLDRIQANEIRRAMCIDLEIILGVDSPAEDSALRMKTQLDRMKTQGLGQNAAKQSSIIEKQKLDWLFLPGAESKLQESLNLRFQELLRKTKIKS